MSDGNVEIENGIENNNNTSKILLKQKKIKPIKEPPIAKSILHKIEIHNQTIIDEYFWLRDKQVFIF